MSPQQHTVRFVGVGRNGRVQHQVPQPQLGQLPCPTCRRPVTLTSRGYLRKHRDLFGHPCYQRNPGDSTPKGQP